MPDGKGRIKRLPGFWPETGAPCLPNSSPLAPARAAFDFICVGLTFSAALPLAIQVTGEWSEEEPEAMKQSSIEEMHEQRRLNEPPTLNSFLACAFMKQARQHNDVLPREAFWKIVKSELHLQLSDLEIESLRLRADENQDGVISWAVSSLPSPTPKQLSLSPQTSAVDM